MRVLITGMSATGKSTVIDQLASRGFNAIDLDSTEWSEWIPVEGNPTGSNPGYDWMWREERVAELLDAVSRGAEPMFVSGCAPNMGRFLPQFDHIVLLHAPVETMLKRLACRSNNVYGKRQTEVEQVLENMRVIEPKLRLMATCEIDTSSSLMDVIGRLMRLVA